MPCAVARKPPLRPAMAVPRQPIALTLGPRVRRFKHERAVLHRVLRGLREDAPGDRPVRALELNPPRKGLADRLGVETHFRCKSGRAVLTTDRAHRRGRPRCGVGWPSSVQLPISIAPMNGELESPVS